MTIEPDTKDWTWVLQRRCPECGFDGPGVDVADLPSAVAANADAWVAVLARPDVERRPAPAVWSPLEYGCHVRDVHVLFDQRGRLMLEEPDPVFANWDQDVTAVEQRYDLQDPAVVAAELRDAATRVAATYGSVSGAQWDRRGRRSNGSAFTVDSIGRYHLHDVVHHLWDVGFDPAAATVAAYDVSATEYAAGTADLSEHGAAAVTAFARRLPPGARVLEIGSGGGRDALALEAAGLSVRRTDITPAFVELLRSEGHAADLADPLHDDLSDPERPGEPYDGVWANASLLHVGRSDLPVVLARLAEVTRPGGVLRLAVKEGDGETWSTHGNVSAPRRFTYWREGPLTEALTGSGWDVVELGLAAGRREESWLELVAERR